ncbi:sigma-70 family RNA polymerase sigma factor [Conexibacter sp. JD483]|uniref:sigma-70 family RNA polymerase sigma factor n=1 Tax=unclassified Conexibacter TaxID=2627773 RepID=UPI00271EBFB7|nr:MULTISPECIES: sigma-70 family RNA polymerase sigma factor [unclassified Conexibacter]MDO8188129.1 sigma-70 family RNA polymerase sigma factor [Conexibacter sp. CPCC 205706]MDO8201307.1 sigma-70 family RNA polymerase sigma factor [Conexibacter sp. CPCC 205762]MDR9370422.1 sigma-70 family RNA polymerase sigma factor [Conexibacter sp. JD483]
MLTRRVRDPGDRRRAAAPLPELERTILCLRFDRELTQTQIAERLGCSQMQISRILRQTIERLARIVSDEPG